MPDDQRAIALEKHRLGHIGDKTRPALKRRRPEFSDQQFSAGGLGERREHCRRDPCSRLRAGGVAAVVQRHTVPRTRQQPGDQPSAQATADDGKVVSPGRAGMGGMHNGVHDDDASSADAAERTEHSTEIEIGRNARFEPWLHARRTKTYFRDETTARKRFWSALCAAPVPANTGRNWKRGGFRKLPSPVLPGSGAKGLSQPRRTFLRCFKWMETRAEAPLFRHRSLKHKSET